MSNNISFSFKEDASNQSSFLMSPNDQSFSPFSIPKGLENQNNYSNPIGEILKNHSTPNYGYLVDQQSFSSNSNQNNVNHYKQVVVTPYDEQSDSKNPGQNSFRVDSLSDVDNKSARKTKSPESNDEKDEEYFQTSDDENEEFDNVKSPKYNTNAANSSGGETALMVMNQADGKAADTHVSRDLIHHQPQRHGSAMIVPSPPGHEKDTFVDITPFLNQPQCMAAKKIGIPTSTLSKRWKEAVRQRKWPFRMVSKLEKEITTILHNLPQGPNAPPLSEETQEALALLLRRRQEELRPVVIRL